MSSAFTDVSMGIQSMATGIFRIVKLVATLAVGIAIGAIIVLTTGCNAVSGLGRDLSQTSDMLHRGIKSYYSQPEGRDLRPDTQLTEGEWRSRYGL